MPQEAKEKILGLNGVSDEVASKMLQHKLNINYSRPTFHDTLAQQAIIISKRATCLWNEVGAIIFYDNQHILSSGYNGPAAGDVDPKEHGCARVVDGQLRQGQGFCRGTHAEMNAINYLTVSTMGLEKLGIMVTLRPCFSCAKHMVNKGIKEVYYLWEYEQDDNVVSYFKNLGVTVIHYTSDFLEDWIQKNNYAPHRIKKTA